MIETGTIEPDRRATPRRRARLFGTMRFANGTTSMTGDIRNLSEGGARLEIANAAWIDREFDLLLGQQGRRVKAEIVWRSSDSIGVRFAEATVTSQSMEEELVFLRAERERLKARIRDLTNEN